MLYELLTGAPPFTHEELLKIGEEEMRRVIREDEPATPSKKLSSSGELPAIAANRHLEPNKLTRLVQGDLDWIVMKCLEKENARRYETANQLGQELQRFLADEPVQAGPPSAMYRAKKFLRRNKGPVIAAAVVFLALVGGFIASTSIGLIQVEQARAAETRQRELAELARKQEQEAEKKTQIFAKKAGDAEMKAHNSEQREMQSYAELKFDRQMVTWERKSQKESFSGTAPFRKRALQWIRADLAAWGKLLDKDADARLVVRERMAHWRTDTLELLTGLPDFGGDLIAQLKSQGGTQGLAGLWKDVETLCRKTLPKDLSIQPFYPG